MEHAEITSVVGKQPPHNAAFDDGTRTVMRTTHFRMQQLAFLPGQLYRGYMRGRQYCVSSSPRKRYPNPVWSAEKLSLDLGWSLPPVLLDSKICSLQFGSVLDI